jgi:hypothetical protein
MQAYDGSIRRLRLALLALLTIAAANAGAQTTTTGGETARVSQTTEMTRAARDRGEQGSLAEREYTALQRNGSGGKGTRSASSTKTGAEAFSGSPNTDFWFHAADVVLFNDHDRDGYFHGVDLLFDADTYYLFADVYAVLYLSLDDGPWNEYAATDVFRISGASSDDEYVVVTELVSGYPRGSYDLLVELFDADTDAFLASYGPVDTPELAFLPLEDQARDAPMQDGTTVVVKERGGGSPAPASLLILLLAALRGALKPGRESAAGSASETG